MLVSMRRAGGRRKSADREIGVPGKFGGADEDVRAPGSMFRATENLKMHKKKDVRRNPKDERVFFYCIVIKKKLALIHRQSCRAIP